MQMSDLACFGSKLPLVIRDSAIYVPLLYIILDSQPSLIMRPTIPTTRGTLNVRVQ